MWPFGSKTKVIKLYLEQAQRENLEKLMSLVGIKSYGALFDQATTLLQWSINQRMAGRQVVSAAPGAPGATEFQMAIFQGIKEDAPVSLRIGVCSVGDHQVGDSPETRNAGYIALKPAVGRRGEIIPPQNRCLCRKHYLEEWRAVYPDQPLPISEAPSLT